MMEPEDFMIGWVAQDAHSPAQRVRDEIDAEMTAAKNRAEVNVRRLGCDLPYLLADGDYLYSDGTTLSDHGPNGPAKPVLWIGRGAES